MHCYKYIIVGGGMTADAAVRGIREIDAEGSIALISDEQHSPYKRPPLSKGLWKGKAEKCIWCKTKSKDATLHLGRRIIDLNTGNKTVADDRGEKYSYDKLLLATGGTPRRLPFDDNGSGIVYFRTLDDYTKLRQVCEQHTRFAVIGGGFIGSEIAAALATNGKQVTLVSPGAGIGARNFPADLVAFLNDYYRQRGVDIVAGERVVGLEREADASVLATDHGRLIPAEVVVAGIGIEPNVELAISAGLEVKSGIRVDMSLRTSRDDIFAAGDVASFYNPALDRFIRVEHEDNAYTMGRAAGQSMAGKAVSYDHLPYFYSDLFDIGYEAVGTLDSRFEMVPDWKEPHREGVVYYLHAGRVRGVLLWNVWGKLDYARGVVSSSASLTSDDLVGRRWE